MFNYFSCLVKNQTLKQIRLWNKPSNFWRFYLFSKLGFSVWKYLLYYQLAVLLILKFL